MNDQVSSIEDISHGVELPSFSLENQLPMGDSIVNLTNAWVGYVILFMFIFAYVLVIFEDIIHLKKAKPMILFSCFMWFFIGIYEVTNGEGHSHAFIEYLIAEIDGLFFFGVLAAVGGHYNI